MTDPDEQPTTGIIDPDTGKPAPRSGPEGGPADSDAGTVARDVAKDGTDEPEDGVTEQKIGEHNTPEETPPAW